MSTIVSIIALLGGIALFLYGMTLMGDGLKKVAGSKMELILYKLTSNRFKGFSLGMAVTGVIQSSSATSIMVVGFVNSGMMKLRNPISIILGAIVGTSVTGWIVCLSYIDSTGSGAGISSLLSTGVLTGIVSIVGILYRMFLKGHTKHRIGDILMGFAILMFGMTAMKTAVESDALKATFTNIISSLDNPFLGILIGIAFTAVLQSASASIGILQALSMAGGMGFGSAFPIMLGVGIGASVPVLISALSASTDGRRVAFTYLLSELFAVIFIDSWFFILHAIIGFDSIMTLEMNPFSIALMNTVVRLINMSILLPFTSLLEKVVMKLIKGKKVVETEKTHASIHLEERFISYPALAIEQSRTTINEMASVAHNSLLSSLWLVNNYSEDGFGEVERLEDLGDAYEDALGTYLVKITAGYLTENQNKDVSKFLHTISDFERISDHALNIGETAKEIHEKSIVFSDDAKHEIEVVTNAVRDIVTTTFNAFVNNDLTLAQRVEPLEELIDGICDEMKLLHINRIKQGICTLNQGFVFNDLLTNLERVADHCSNIAVAIIELESSEVLDTHEYLNDLKKANDTAYEKYYKEYAAKYHI